MNRKSFISSVDWLTIVLYLIMVFFGWVNIYGASYNFEQTSRFDLSNPAGKQFLWMMISFVIAVAILIIDESTYETIAYILYALLIALLIITPLIAKDVKGSYSWISIGPLRIQPAEFAKFVTALALAKWLSRYDFKIETWRDLVVPMALIIAPMLIIMVWQRETGSALVFLAFFIVLYREGMSGYFIASGVALVVLVCLALKFQSAQLPLGVGNWGSISYTIVLLLIVLAIDLLYSKDKRGGLMILITTVLTYATALVVNIWLTVDFSTISLIVIGFAAIILTVTAIVDRQNAIWILLAFMIVSTAVCEVSDNVLQKLPDHQRNRIEVILKIKEDPKGVEYNVIQAKIAIGSGGFKGKGHLKGTQSTLRFVPEQHTDFIFSTIGEEFGFLGTIGVIVAFVGFLLRLIFLAERQKDKFSQVYGYSVASIFFVHFTINIGMVLGFLPVIGIPLPFFSYGGSSLMAFTILLFIFLKLDAARVEKL